MNFLFSSSWLFFLAVEALDKSTDCMKCLKVTATNTGKSIYVLAVDTGGQGLDISSPAFLELFGQKTDASPASWG